MNESKINLDHDTHAFEPGSRISGTIEWKLDTPPKHVELRLFWFTKGAGDQDVKIVDEMRVDQNEASVESYGRKQFSFLLPSGPFSFSGKLVSLIWALELVIPGVPETARVELVVAPGGREINLYDHAQAP
jgi:hypothetical protein